MSIGFEFYQQACQPGADPHAIWYREAMLEMLKMMMAGPMNLLGPWMHDGEPDDAVFQVMSRFPIRFLGHGAPQQGLPFDVEQFLKELEEAAPGIS